MTLLFPHNESNISHWAVLLQNVDLMTNRGKAQPLQQQLPQSLDKKETKHPFPLIFKVLFTYAAPLHKTQIMCKRGVTEKKEELKLSSRGDFGVKVLLQRRSRSYRCSVCLWWLHDHHLRNTADNQELQELLSHSAAFSLSVEGWLKAQQLCWWQAVVTTSTEHQHSSTNKWEECVCIKASEWPVKADLRELLLATATSPGFHVQADPEKLVDALVSIRPDRWTPQKTINQSTLLHYTKVHCTKTSHWLQVSYKVDLKVVFRLRWHEGHGDRMKPSGSSTWNNPQADTDKLTCPKNERC